MEGTCRAPVRFGNCLMCYSVSLLLHLWASLTGRLMNQSDLGPFLCAKRALGFRNETKMLHMLLVLTHFGLVWLCVVALGCRIPEVNVSFILLDTRNKLLIILSRGLGKKQHPKQFLVNTCFLPWECYAARFMGGKKLPEKRDKQKMTYSVAKYHRSV